MKRLICLLAYIGLSVYGLNHAIAAEGDYPKGEWVQLFNGKDLTGWTPKIRYHELGDNNEVIRHLLDGEVVLEYNKPQLDERDGYAKKLIKDGNLMLTGGTISLQSESHPIDFRKVEIMVLEE